MKNITYTIEHNIVFMNVYDTELEMIMNFKGIYKGKNKEDCERWLKEYKEGLKQ